MMPGDGRGSPRPRVERCGRLRPWPRGPALCVRRDREVGQPCDGAGAGPARHDARPLPGSAVPRAGTHPTPRRAVALTPSSAAMMLGTMRRPCRGLAIRDPEPIRRREVPALSRPRPWRRCLGLVWDHGGRVDRARHGAWPAPRPRPRFARRPLVLNRGHGARHGSRSPGRCRSARAPADLAAHLVAAWAVPERAARSGSRAAGPRPQVGPRSVWCAGLAGGGTVRRSDRGRVVPAPAARIVTSHRLIASR